jgi:pimeloyl-ACP methyl ester carboxylesterase
VQNPQFYGDRPYRVVTIHGGPGAMGSVTPVARSLGNYFGVLEPMQTALSVEGQVEELRNAIVQHAAPPVALVGHSWGAWLAFLLAARCPGLVSKLILVSSGPFLESWTAGMMDTRLAHLTPEEGLEVQTILAKLDTVEGDERNRMFGRMGELMGKADTYAQAPAGEAYETAGDGAVYNSVWNEAALMRRSGALLAQAESIACPVVAIHGDYDPHPWQGVKEPLEKSIKDFRFVLLERCGHEPWEELWAREKFYEILRTELE